MPKKSLGQHWLHDRQTLADIAMAAELSGDDVVLEIGPGLGTLTSELLRHASEVVAVEFDQELATKLPGQFPGKHLKVINEDILSFDLSALPANYKVVANVPYYISSKIVQKLAEASNSPSVAVLLVQKEVAQRIAASPGGMSMLSLAAQVYFEAGLDIEVPRELFTPPPEVDSQVVVLTRRAEPLVEAGIRQDFFRVARAGFGERRKKLRSSLSGGLRLSKPQTDHLLQAAGIAPEARAQELSVSQWLKLTETYLAAYDNR